MLHYEVIIFYFAISVLNCDTMMLNLTLIAVTCHHNASLCHDNALCTTTMTSL